MKKEIIEQINYFDTIEDTKEKEKIIKSLRGMYKYMEGYHIKTNKQNIYILIAGIQQCCESWGYEACTEEGIIETKDDLQDFIGAELLSIERVEAENHNNIEIYSKLEEKIKEDCFNYPDTEFINVKTSNGVLQFVLYNSHNGYYGHEVYIKFNDREIKSFL